jgi:hypothetical protein
MTTSDPDRYFGLILPLDFVPGRLIAALAEAYAVPASEVDVADGNQMERNWTAAVRCTFEPAAGDVTWFLDLYISDAVPIAPTVAQAAAILAQRLGQPVLYEAETLAPMSYWMATPAGWRTRASLDDSNSEDTDSLVIVAVERPVKELPGAPVQPIPEVIRGVLMPTPIRDKWASTLPEPPVTGDPVWYASDRLGAWEQLTVRMASGWPPDGWYPLAYYREDLANRDDLSIAALALPPALVDSFQAALGQVDEAFKAHTRKVGNSPDSPGRGWWWQQMPEPEPWDNSPGRRASFG